jgi:quercetin dioxygenase-like cupin family protein
MPEIVYGFSIKNDKTFEKLVEDDQLAINHIILNKGDDVPTHKTNSNIYILIIRGELTVGFANKETRIYTSGQLVKVPFCVEMNMVNSADDPVEFFVIKSPSPKHMQKKT